MTTIPLLGVETPPTSLRLPVGTNIWGIDPSTHRIALMILQGRGMDTGPELGWFCLNVAPMDKGAYRLRELRRGLIPWMRRYAAVAPPAAVTIEQPFAGGDGTKGKRALRPHPQSYYVVGVTLEACADAFGAIECDVGLIDPMSWKRDALGEGLGAAKKSQVLGWAQQHGYPGDCPECHGQGRTSECKPCEAHDIADAGGIATCTAVRYLAGRALR